MRRTTPALPVESTEPAPLLSQTIEGQHAPRANPEPCPFLISFYYKTYHMLEVMILISGGF